MVHRLLRARRQNIMPNPILPGSPLGIEVELAIFDMEGRPLISESTRKVRDVLEPNLVACKEKLVVEVGMEIAVNSIEVKFLSTVATVRDDFVRVHSAICKTIRDIGALIIGTSQPSRSQTIISNPGLIESTIGDSAPTNSVHLHLGIRDYEDGILLYNAGTRIAPVVLALTQCSMIDGRERGRARMLAAYLTKLRYCTPPLLSDMADFESWLRKLDRSFPGVEPRDLPLFVRLRPDKKIPELYLVGSVEFRPIDGQPTLQAYLAAIEFALGLWAYETQFNSDILTHEEIHEIIKSTERIAELGLGGVTWNGLIDVEHTYRCAINGLFDIGIKPEYILDRRWLPLDGGNAEFERVRGLSPEEIVKMNHERFMGSIR